VIWNDEWLPSSENDRNAFFQKKRRGAFGTGRCRQGRQITSARSAR